MKWRRKVTIIEARQLNVDNIEMMAAWCNGHIKGTKLPIEDRVIEIYDRDSEREMVAAIGDFIIQENGRFRFCKESLFRMEYEPIGKWGYDEE